jgi:hypothetical protein
MVLFGWGVNSSSSEAGLTRRGSLCDDIPPDVSQLTIDAKDSRTQNEHNHLDGGING